MDSGDDVQLTHPAAVHRTFASYDIDAAFDDDDDDDGDTSFHFSPDSIRKEMSRRISEVQDAAGGDQDTEPKSTFSSRDNSVSTLDMNGDGQASPVPSSGSLSPVNMSPQFVSISLSRSTSGPIPDDKTSDVDVGDDDDDDSRSIHQDEYPAVHIDASRPPGHRVTLSTDSRISNGTDAYTSPPDLPTDEQGRHSSSQSIHARTSSPSSNGQSSSPAPSPTHVVASSVTASSISELSASMEALPKTTHRPTRSLGPSMLEKVMSKTRPSFLPPKNKQEDNKHLADWQSMMKQSRLAAEKRRKALQERRLERERKIDESLHLWERDIVPDWRVVHKNPALRKMWWRGIPTKLRASMWERAVGNPLALSKDSYRTCLSRAKRALAAGTFPSATLALIDQDVSTTLPSLNLFHAETGPLCSDLKDMLFAWVVSRSDEGLGYTLGAARIAGMLLINLTMPQAFVVMRNLLERHCLRSFFGGEAAKADVEAYYRIFDTLLADGMPKIYFNFKQHQISPASYLPDWLVPLFLDHLPFDACARVWDVIILEGDAFLYRAALGILAVLEPRLFFPEKKELLELLKGENKAAIDVAIREGQSLNGGKYEIYGVDEETLWERIDSMEDWWKESTWTRLIQRELPDL